MSGSVDPNEWKHPDVAADHLATNERELLNNPPLHWNWFRECMIYIRSTEGRTFYDLGCATGVAVHLLDMWGHSSIPYVGLDFSESMIDLAKKNWGRGAFFVEDFLNSDRDYSGGILYCSGVVGLLPEPETVLRKLLSLGGDYIILNRETVGAEDEDRPVRGQVNYFQHTFSKRAFSTILEEGGYTILHKVAKCYLLKKL